MRAAKQRIIEQLRRDYPQLKARWGGDNGYDGWFQLPINNAQLNDVDTYYALVPAFLRILKANGGDLEKFYKEVATLAKLNETERHRRLNALLTAYE